MLKLQNTRTEKKRYPYKKKKRQKKIVEKYHKLVYEKTVSKNDFLSKEFENPPPYQVRQK